MHMTDQRDQLFVKVDGYQEVLDELTSVKDTMTEMQDALDVIREIRDVKENTLNTFLDHINTLNKRLENIARELPDVDSSPTKPASDIPQKQRPQPRSTPDRNQRQEQERGRSADAIEEEVIENSVQDLHQELRKLKNSLRDLEK